ncbi:hypothetical protein [Arthrobacter sp. SDTb3-6]|uniref:hypothetical protein n=1 Tax=Arthrobacter sp. SDTb3-6 TaxID=2713571 RepID=UPI00159D0526|nr:hypothetical protein [Arthrobacter sp. SDTb3-6]NVN00432.1 hypothetical protein [Arthrobacter sp. SDTb3-6]
MVVEQFPQHRLVDLGVLTAAVAGRDPDSRLVGVGGGDRRNHLSLSEIIQQSLTFPRFPLSRPDFKNQATGPRTPPASWPKCAAASSGTACSRTRSSPWP